MFVLSAIDRSDNENWLKFSYSDFVEVSNFWDSQWMEPIVFDSLLKCVGSFSLISCCN